MKLFQALSNIIIIQTSLWYIPVVLCDKSQMNSAAAEDNNDNGMDRVLKSSSIDDGRYPYSRNYVVIIEPDNFISLFTGGTLASLNGIQGTSIVEFGNVFDPADIEIVNRSDGSQEGDIGFPSSAMCDGGDTTGLIGNNFAGDRQPKSPIPPGDKAYFFHGECVALSGTQSSSVLEATDFASNSQLEELDNAIDSLVQTSHTCNLNLCLGGGGFDCIAIYAGTAFTFNVGQQVRVGIESFSDDVVKATPSLPPPFPATIIGGTGSFEGIEGTVDIATICGTTGLSNAFLDPARRSLQGAPPLLRLKIGYIVQSIKVKSNMPLPVAP